MSIAFDGSGQMTGSIDIPSLPVGMASIVSVANSDAATADDVAQAIMLDPALSTKVLRMANSAFYGRLTRAETVTQAVVTLGFSAVRTIALAASVVEHVLPEESVPGLDWRAFWQHCVSTGAAAELLHKEISGSRRGGESAFVAGLLHDVGKLVIARSAPNSFANAVAEARSNGGDLLSAERNVLGTDHTSVGSMLAEAWRIPDAIAAPISIHHAEEPETDQNTLVLAVRGGNALSKIEYGSYLMNCPVTLTAADVADLSGLSEAEVGDVTQDLPDRISECEEILGWGAAMPDGGSAARAA